MSILRYPFDRYVLCIFGVAGLISACTPTEVESSPAEASRAPSTVVSVAPPRAASSPATTDAIYSIAAHGVIPGPLPGSGEYLGSGCTPASDALPDGIWFGLVRGAGEGAIGLDLACFRWIDDPADAIEPGGWGVDNSGPEVWSVPVASGTAVTCQPSDCPQPYMAYAAWAQLTRDYLDAHPEAAMWIEGNDFGIMVWLYVNGGRTTEIVEPVLGG